LSGSQALRFPSTEKEKEKGTEKHGTDDVGDRVERFPNTEKRKRYGN